MMKNKFKVISYIKWPDGTFNSPGDFKLNKGDYTKIVEFYNLLVKKYCQLHNYEFEFREINNNDLQDIKQQLTDDWQLLDDSTIQLKTTEIVLYKLKYVKEVLKRNEDEYVVFFDTDAIPSNPNIKLEEFIDDEHEIFVSPGNKYMDFISASHQLLPVLSDMCNNKNNLLDLFCNDPTVLCEKIQKEKNINLIAKFEQFVKIFAGFNEGFFIVKNTPKMKKLFSLMCNNYQIGIHRGFNSSADGHLMWYFLTPQYFYSSLKYMKFNCMGHHLGYGPYLYNEDTTFLLHDSDIISMKDRSKSFEIMIHNKWWTPILNENKDDICLLIIKYSSFKNLNTNIINQIQNFINDYKDKQVYITLDIFYVNQPYQEFINVIKNNYFKIWNGEHINKIYYI